MVKVCKKCGGQFPHAKVIDGKLRALSSRHYCLKCSPFKEGKMGGQLRQKPSLPAYTKKCNICETTKKSSEFYEFRRRGKVVLYGRCRFCANDYKLSKDIEKKRKAIAHLGGACVKCGYKEHHAALVFHHLRDKKFGWYQLRNKGWSTIEEELKKCELLCANCHIILHSKTPVHF